MQIYHQEQRQSFKIQQLQDICDYTSYIDQRIKRLDSIYQRLSNGKVINKNNQLYRKETSKNNCNNNCNNEQPKFKLYQTIQQRIRSVHRKTPSFLQSMDKSQNLQSRNRYADNSQQYYSIQMKSTNRASKTPSQRPLSQTLRVKSKSQKEQKQKDYQRIKNQMLGTFFVGGNKTRYSNFQPHYDLRHQQWKESLVKIGKGRVWRGRAPVKIIQKIQ